MFSTVMIPTAIVIQLHILLWGIKINFSLYRVGYVIVALWNTVAIWEQHLLCLLQALESVLT